MLTRLTCAVLLVAAISAAADRDWTKHPAIVEIDTNSDIYAIGDIHSDYVRLTQLVNGAGLIDGIPGRPTDVHWSARHSVLIVTGDMIDKGPRALDVLRFLTALRTSADSQGGRVVLLAGNHEAEFLANPRAGKGAEFAAELAAKDIAPADVASCKGEIGQLLCGLPFAARVNDWFFSHAGNSGGRTLSQIATGLQFGFNQYGFASDELLGEGSILEARLNGTGKGRAEWIDAGLPERDEKQLLAAYTVALGVQHIVQGHVPSEVRFADGAVRRAGEMFQRFGLLFLIDTGLSGNVDYSHGAVLHITSTEAAAVCADGKQTLLWDSKHRQAQGRAAPCG